MNNRETAQRLRQMKEIMINLKKLTDSFYELCEGLDSCYDYRTEIHTFEWIVEHIGASIESDLNYLE